MTVSVYIDNSVWDFLFEHNLNLANELPKDEFCVCITREAEFEIPPIPSPALRKFIEETIESCSISTDSFFGYCDENLPIEEQRVKGYDEGRWATKEEFDFIEQQKTSLGRLNQKTRLFQREADISLAARSFQAVVLSLDAKRGPINTAYKQGGKVIFLKNFDPHEMTLREFIKKWLEVPNGKTYV